MNIHVIQVSWENLSANRMKLKFREKSPILFFHVLNNQRVEIVPNTNNYITVQTTDHNLTTLGLVCLSACTNN